MKTKCLLGFTVNFCQNPENPPFEDRYMYAQVYYGLLTEEALWLVSRHNNNYSLRKENTRLRERLRSLDSFVKVSGELQ